MPLFVFNDLVASFVSFFVYFQFRVSPSAGTIPAIPRASSVTGPCLRQCVHIMTTIIGYHVALGLSSENALEARGPAFPALQLFGLGTVGCCGNGAEAFRPPTSVANGLWVWTTPTMCDDAPPMNSKCGIIHRVV